MGKLYSFVLGLVIGAGIYHLALHNHVVRASDGWHFVAKTAPTLKDSYVDIRQFTPANWLEHPELVDALTEAGLGNLMTGAVENAVGQGLEDLLGEPDPFPPVAE